MNRNNRQHIAEQTLEIIENGEYYVNNQSINIAEDIHFSNENTKLYKPEAFDKVLIEAEKKLKELAFQTQISVKNCTVLEAISELNLNNQQVGCLNFASAKNPGGGFLGGAQAQEESLARASTLYSSLMKHYEMYEYNRSQHTYLYSDYMIYSPEVVFFRDDSNALLEKPYKVSILTSPAVNVGAIKQNKPSELPLVKETMMNRLDKVLAVFVVNGIKNLVLGAWGCGVFHNNPVDVAQYFAYYLKNDGKYAKAFEHILFAVLDRNGKEKNISAFEKALL